MGVRRRLARSLTSLALLRAPKSANTVPAAILSGRIPPHDTLQPGTEESASPPTTPDMVRSGRVLPNSVKSPKEAPQSKLSELLQDSIELLQFFLIQ